MKDYSQKELDEVILPKLRKMEKEGKILDLKVGKDGIEAKMAPGVDIPPELQRPSSSRPLAPSGDGFAKAIHDVQEKVSGYLKDQTYGQATIHNTQPTLAAPTTTSFPEFIDAFLRGIDKCIDQNKYPRTNIVLKMMKKAHIFWMGESTGESTNKNQELVREFPHLVMPFDNMLIVNYHPEMQLWNVQHWYRPSLVMDQYEAKYGEKGTHVNISDETLYETLSGYQARNKTPNELMCMRSWDSDREGSVGSSFHALLEVGDLVPREEGIEVKIKCLPLMYCTPSALVGIEDMEAAKDTDSAASLIDFLSEIIIDLASLSYPGKYAVRVTPRLTPKEKSRKSKGKNIGYRKRQHYIVLDHQRVTLLNPANRGTSRKSPRAHRRRAHVRRVSPRYRKLKALGIEFVKVRPSIVGDPVFADEKNQYVVLMEGWKE